MIHSQLSSEAQCSISEVEKISKIFVLEKKLGVIFLILEVLKKFWIFYRIHGVRTKINSILGRASLCKYIHVDDTYFIFLRVRHVLRKLKSFGTTVNFQNIEILNTGDVTIYL